ncbi:hypothetical protein D3C78_919620 [compost metagenome]
MKSSISSTLPWATNSTNSVMRRPKPVSVIAPTMMPAVPVAMATPIMLRLPAFRPCTTSFKPARKWAAIWPDRRNQASSACWVDISISITTMAQKAARAGESSSTIRAQIKVPTGSRKWVPALTVDQVSRRLGLVTSMPSGKSGSCADRRTDARYSISITPPTAQAA